MRYHHHEHNFLRGVVENEDFDILDNEGFFEAELDNEEDASSAMSHRAKARKMIEEHLENRRNKLRDSDPFEDDNF